MNFFADQSLSTGPLLEKGGEEVAEKAKAKDGKAVEKVETIIITQEVKTIIGNVSYFLWNDSQAWQYRVIFFHPSQSLTPSQFLVISCIFISFV